VLNGFEADIALKEKKMCPYVDNVALFGYVMMVPLRGCLSPVVPMLFAPLMCGACPAVLMKFITWLAVKITVCMAWLLA